ncbi:MAG TPA: CDP-alcohol phosphatidyltransferase family protein [Solirubrobacteraceae bacterium]|nr:CDP-alcohol phosphatidyltransferase family protein [Solirubrobacteraceae bacterium]
MPRARLSALRLLGLDRSGPPPPQTDSGAPLRPWTIPNAISYARAVLIPVFLVLDYRSRSGTDTAAAICFFIAGAGDYADGIAARVTGQFSRLGAILDPALDRTLALAGLAVCWSYELLPRWLVALVLAREALVLLVGQAWVRRGLTLRINWPGRIAVGPTLFGIWLALLGVRGVAEGFLLAGITLALLATGYYFRDARRQLRVSSSA